MSAQAPGPEGQPFILQPAAPAPRRANPWKWVVIGCGGLTALTVCLGIAGTMGLLGAIFGGSGGSSGGSSSGGASGSSATAPAYSVGQTASVKNWDVTVANVEQPGKDLVWSSVGNKTQAVGKWVVVEVNAKNTGNTNFGVNTTDFEIRDAQGNTYRPSTEGLGFSTFKGGQSVGGQVPPSGTAKYFIPFDVGEQSTGLQFVFRQDTRPVFALGQ